MLKLQLFLEGSILTPIFKILVRALITVTSIFGKLFEYALLNKFEYSQSDMQFRFTEGLSPMMTSLLVSEAKAESSDQKSRVYVYGYLR